MTQGDPPRVTVITVAYNSAQVIGGMLNSLPQGTRAIIVDNGSRDVDRLRDMSRDTGATLIENDANHGFGRACNTGAAAATTEFLLFLNPDARLQPGAVEALVAAATRDPTASAFNPRITDDTGARVLKRKSDLVPRVEHLPRGADVADRDLPVLTGAAIFIARDTFHRVGGFDPAIFLFYEDDDLSLRLRREAGPLRLVPEAHVTHAGGTSTSGPRRDVERLKAWHMGWSRLYTMRKHARPFARTRALAHATLRVASPATLLSPLRRTKRAAFLAGTWAALRGRPADLRLPD